MPLPPALALRTGFRRNTLVEFGHLDHRIALLGTHKAAVPRDPKRILDRQHLALEALYLFVANLDRGRCLRGERERDDLQ